MHATYPKSFPIKISSIRVIETIIDNVETLALDWSCSIPMPMMKGETHETSATASAHVRPVERIIKNNNATVEDIDSREDITNMT